jgi:CRP-like cAMP-binding protein
MSKKVILAGDLDFLSMADLLQLIGSNACTGILRIKSKYSQDQGLVYIIDGNPADASSGSLTGLDALYSLFGWIEGGFEFSKEHITRKKVINESRMQIILDGLKRLDDGQIKKIGPVSLERTGRDSSGKETGLPLIKRLFVDYMYVVDEEEFLDGSKIIKEGKHGGWFWVILEGVVEIVRETSQGPLSLVRLGEGAFIGSVASFLIEGNVRSATVVAIGNVQLGVLDLQRLSTEYVRMSQELREFVLSLDKRLRQVTDRAVEVFLKESTLGEFAKDRKPVIKQGKNYEKILTIEQGEASIVKETDHGDVPLANLGKGDFIGHVPFLDIGHEPYYASVFGSEDLEARELDLDNLRKEYDQVSATLRYFMENVATCVSVTTKVACDLQKKIAGNKKSGNS